MAAVFNETLTRYIELNKKLTELRKSVKDHKEQAQTLEKEIMDYMTQNNMDSISLKDGQIVIYTKKISQAFKKDSIVETLTEKLQDQDKAEDLATSIIQNKKYVTEKSVKALLKKKI
ncbi:hypothetical protein EB118_03525 [bacterium]|nr:hypothetical protein [bacterium]NDC94050.1 hypothetical protein [bacterium]NDD82736.1 hypothetical protein [bacterium]NDG29156.1 hypothetical protein [bacterium]